MMARSGIYQIRNTVTGKRYIGQALDITRRIYTHRRLLERGEHSNRHLQNSWNKHGSGVFAFGPLAIIEPALLTFFEQRAADFYGELSAIYNQGDCVKPNRLGCSISAEVKRRIGAGNVGKNLGKVRSAETRRKISASKTGKRLGPMSEKRRSDISIRMLGNGNSSGRTLSGEHRQRISQALMGHSVSPETRHKISETKRLRGQ